MKILKKWIGAFLSVQMLIFGTSATVFAADGVITLTDLQTKVGEVFTINCKIDGKGTSLTSANVEMSYDPEYIQIISGDDIDTSVAGKLIYDGEGSGDVLRFSMELQALKEGEIRIRLDNATVTTTSGREIEMSLGYSDIKIGAGDPSNIVESPMTPSASAITVMVNNESYSLLEDFKDMDLPRGFSRGVISYNGESYEGAVQDNGIMQLAYLMNEAGEQIFFIYDGITETFTPFEQVLISAETYIILLQKDEDINVPNGFEEVKLTMNNHEFQAWQEMDNLEFYLIFAQNESGERGFYRYDSGEQTYQRYAMEGSVLLKEDNQEEVASDTEADNILGKLLNYMENHIEQVFIAIILLLILFIMLLIVLGVKLHNRNLELDEFYDEYDIDAVPEELEEPESKKSKKGKKVSKQEPEERFEDDEDFDDFEDDDDFDEIKDDDDFGDFDEIDDDFDDLEDDDFEDFDEDDDLGDFDDFDEDDDFDDLEEVYEKPKKKVVKKSEKRTVQKKPVSKPKRRSAKRSELEFIDLD